MYTIKIFFDPPLIAAMLETVLATVSSLENRLALPAIIPDEDPELAQLWFEDLLKNLTEDCEYLSEILTRRDFGQGEITLKEETADGALRAASAIRLALRETVLAKIDDETLETGGIDILALATDQQRCYACYLFLATLQSVIIYAIDPDSEF